MPLPAVRLITCLLHGTARHARHCGTARLRGAERGERGEAGAASCGERGSSHRFRSGLRAAHGRCSRGCDLRCCRVRAASISLLLPAAICQRQLRRLRFSVEFFANSNSGFVADCGRRRDTQLFVFLTRFWTLCAFCGQLGWARCELLWCGALHCAIACGLSTAAQH